MLVVTTTAAKFASQCFVESEKKAGYPTDTSIGFSDVDILASTYEPGMEVKAFVACYDEDLLPRKLISLRPLIGIEKGDEYYEPLTKLGP